MASEKKAVRELEGGPGGPWPPQYLALPRLESSEKATTLANLASKPPILNETRFEGKISRRGQAKQILVVRK